MQQELKPDEFPLPDAKEFYINTSLYTVFKIGESDKEKVYDIIHNTTSVDCYCVSCGKNSTFKIEEASYGEEKISAADWEFQLQEMNVIHEITFFCSRNKEHFLSFFVQLGKGSICKIGQTPSLADISHSGIKEFKSILGEIHYNEFKKAIGLHAHGIGIGAFVYLRRIFENLIVKRAYDQARTREGWEEDTYQRARFKEKIKILSADLPEILASNPTFYSIISKGIHQMSEQECKQHFPLMRTFLELVLIEIQNERKLAEKKKQVQEQLTYLSNKLMG